MIRDSLTALPRTLALGVVVYNPEPDLIPRLRTAHDAGFRLYLFDNTPDRDAVRTVCRELRDANYFTSGRNVGLGVGIATLCASAWFDGADALLFFDQDTVFDASTLAFIRDFHEVRRDLSATHSAVVFKAATGVGQCAVERFTTRDVTFVISSGSLFLLDNVHRIGWHNPTYFVDCVDYEFCLNSSNHGFRVAECLGTPGLDHESEQADRTYVVFGRRLRLRRYRWSRIIDAVGASLRISWSAIVTGNSRYLVAISKSLLGYVWWQLVARVVPRSSELS